jgi:hypothetical protein
MIQDMLELALGPLLRGTQISADHVSGTAFG